MIFAPRVPEIKRNLAPQTICLTFHDVIPVRTANSLWFDCSVSEFRSELDWLVNRGAHFISVQQLYRHLTSNAPLPSFPVCITFADNYLGFYTNAYPILKTRKIPSAMFVHTGYVGAPIGRPKMTWNQLIQLDREGLVAVESQTVTHPADLKTLSKSQLDREMVDSKVSLEQHLGHRIDFIAYPNGKFDKRSEQAAKAAGYKMGFSEVLRPAESSPSIFAVARYVHTKFRLAWYACRGN
jgi:peptidoglycan/xylan/chitin deacetylase (PgdA/CDA1 family)